MSKKNKKLHKSKTVLKISTDNKNKKMDKYSIRFPINKIELFNAHKKEFEDITYTYAIFPTKKGKGYGCFAVQSNGNGFYAVAASFCAPSDRAKFSKQKARDVAKGRLLSKTVVIVSGECGEERNRESLVNIIETFMLSNQSIPRWVQSSVKNNLWLHTLKYDSLPAKKIVNEVVMNITGMDLEQVEFLRELFLTS